MERTFFLQTQRLGFSQWTSRDSGLARLLWGDPGVTRYICASGVFSEADIAARLDKEIENGEQRQVQYWPVFALATGELVGCCGLRPHGEKTYEIGFHLRPPFWGKGYAQEAARAVIRYAFGTLGAQKLFAGHNPKNEASRKALSRLGFAYIGDEFYAPTGLMHPSYELTREAYQASVCGEMNMEIIRQARFAEFAAVRAFYHELIDRMQNAEYKPAWEKGVYPSDEYLRASVERGELWLCECDGRAAAAMIVNHACNEGYRGVRWSVEAEEDQVTVIHALGVMPTYQGRGLAGKMVKMAVKIARENDQKALRLDMLEGNLPAERLYVKHGFAYVDTVSMFYEDTGWTNFRLFEHVL